MEKNRHLLTINGGSSSVKFSIYGLESLELQLSGAVDHIGMEHGHIEISGSNYPTYKDDSSAYENIAEAVKAVTNWLKDNSEQFPIAAIGHRLVQGGPEHRQPEAVTNDLLKDLEQFVYLAPNHLPDEIKTIKTFQQAFPNIPQVACFDTAFHRDMPDWAKYYPLDPAYRDRGLMRYGFHGLSYEYILQKLTKDAPSIASKKIIIAHLGNGASMAAVKNGMSVDTTMGISPTGGLVMSTRSGDLDPGVLLFLLKQEKFSPTQLDELLSKHAGLKAIAGVGDVQALLKAEPHDNKAAEALTVFCYHTKKFIGALATAMGGLDLLVFTGGIGEHSAVIRERVCQNMEFMGIKLSKKLNKNHAECISKKASKVAIKVLRTNEELMIAQHTQKILKHLL